MLWTDVRGVEAQLHLFLKSAVVGGEWLTSRPDSLVKGTDSGTRSAGGCVGPTDGLDVSEKT
jgi:hypothetical protein